MFERLNVAEVFNFYEISKKKTDTGILCNAEKVVGQKNLFFHNRVGFRNFFLFADLHQETETPQTIQFSLASSLMLHTDQDYTDRLTNCSKMNLHFYKTFFR
jgi:hypothetical protein